MTLRVWVEEPDPTYRDDLIRSISAPEFDVQHVEVPSSRALSLVNDPFPEVVVLGGAEAIESLIERLCFLRQRYVLPPVLAYLGPPTAWESCQLLTLGVVGYVPQTVETPRLVQSLRTAAAGQSLWGSQDLRKVLCFIANETSHWLDPLEPLLACQRACDRISGNFQTLRTVYDCARYAATPEERRAVVRLAMALGAPLYQVEYALDWASG